MYRESRGQLFVVSAPSGVGKTTIIQAILPRWPQLRYSVSSTTRRPRPGETNGKDYHFLSREAFMEGIQAGRFIEWAQVHGHYYGTDGEQLERWLVAQNDVLLDIDVQGARLVKTAYAQARTIFILPPSLDVLAERLKKRGTESADQLAKRLGAAMGEIREAVWYDFLIVNDALEEAIADMEGILRAGRCQGEQQSRLLRHYLLPTVP